MMKRYFGTAFCAFAITLPLASMSAVAAGALCDYQSSNYATLDPRDFNGCVKLRTQGDPASESPVVWALSDKSRFATQCAVKSIGLVAHQYTACSKVPELALKNSDMLRIDEWPGGQLELVIRRGSASVFAASQGPVMLTPATVKVSGIPDDIRIGYFAKALVPNSNGKGSTEATYYVYLENTVQEGQTVRWYTVEVFDQTKACQAEIPGSTIIIPGKPATDPRPVPCSDNSLKVNASGTIVRGATAPKKGDTLAPAQFPSGGGGEAPPG